MAARCSKRCCAENEDGRTRIRESQRLAVRLLTRIRWLTWPDRRRERMRNVGCTYCTFARAHDPKKATFGISDSRASYHHWRQYRLKGSRTSSTLDLLRPHLLVIVRERSEVADNQLDSSGRRRLNLLTGQCGLLFTLIASSLSISLRLFLHVRRKRVGRRREFSFHRREPVNGRACRDLVAR